MANSNDELVQLICDALRSEALITDKIAPGLSAAILSGKIKAEDWYSAIEKSLPVTQGGNDGNQGTP